MSHRNLVIITKIILFYSIFYIFMKAVILFQGAWLLPNLLLILPFLVLACISGWQVKKEKYSWVFVLIGAAIIILTRIYETRLSFWIESMVSS